MRKLGRPAAILGLLLAVSVGGALGGEDRVAIRISNESTDDIVVTVYDMNATPPEAVVLRQRINGFAWIPASVTAGATGTGHVRWTATSAGAYGAAGAERPRCGHYDKRGLANDESVGVFANSGCAAPTISGPRR
jgi:hypothetical protein